MTLSTSVDETVPLSISESPKNPSFFRYKVMFVPFNPFDGYVVTTNFGVALASNVRLLSPPVKLYVDSYVPLAAKAVNTEENKTTAKK